MNMISPMPELVHCDGVGLAGYNTKTPIADDFFQLRTMTRTIPLPRFLCRYTLHSTVGICHYNIDGWRYWIITGLPSLLPIPAMSFIFSMFMDFSLGQWVRVILEWPVSGLNRSLYRACHFCMHSKRMTGHSYILGFLDVSLS